MIRTGFLWLSERRGVFNFVKSNRIARHFASRFVAGETLDTAIEAARRLNEDGISASLDLLGESVTNRAEAAAARDEVLRILDRIAATGADANVSIKLTQMGLDLDYDLCRENAERVLDKAREHGIFVRLDMESSAYTDRTLSLFHDHLHPKYQGLVGVVIQTSLRRSSEDIDRLIATGARVRLCKGAYAEPPSVAFPDKRDVDAAYATLAERLLERGEYPAIATHDEELIRHVEEYVARRELPASRFEFQMLYGVRRDLQLELRKKGYNVRVYVPFGTEWYPYLMRRLAERPANVAFMIANILREGVTSR